jgi:HK97 family phage prohead protease
MDRKNFEFEIKSIDEKGEFIAYASTFGNTDLVDDIVQKGAFIKSLANRPASDVLMLWQHDTSAPIGEWKSMEEDEKGLLVKGSLFIDDIQQAKEARFLMMKKLVRKLSIGFKITKKAFENGKRRLKEIDLREVSIVTFPANPEADFIGVKCLKDLDIREFERKLRDECGLSQKEAKAVCAEGFKGLQRDAVDADEKKKDEAEWSEVIKKLKDFEL